MNRLLFLTLLISLTASHNLLADSKKDSGSTKILSKLDNKTDKDSLKYNLVVPRNYNNLELRIKKDNYWKPVNLLMNDNKTNLAAGSYRFQIVLQSSIAKFKGEFKVSDPKVLHAIYSTASPDQKYIYVWHSTAKKATPAYKQEKQLRVCLSPVNTPGVYREAEYPQSAFDACKRLAEQKQPDALAQMGHFYRKGIHVKQDLAKAKSLLRQAFKLNHYNAGAELFAIAAEEGQLSADIIKILKVLSEQEMYFASASLSISYLQGRMVKQDIKKSKQYALKAVDQGSAMAFSLVANAILQEDRLNPDIVEALAWVYARLRTFYEIDYRVEKFAQLLEDELTDAEMTKARKRSLDILKNLKGKYQASLYIGNIFDNPDYRNKKLSMKVNSDETMIDIIPGKTNQLNFLFSGAQKHRIEFYLDGEMEFIKYINYPELNSTQLCLFYDKEYKVEEIAPMEETKLCG